MAEQILDSVRSKYGAVAQSTLSNDDARVKAVAEAFGYTAEELTSIPAGANMGLSCGNPTATAHIKQGEVVVDLGSGGGLDVFLASKMVGPEGRAIGIDMTPAMIERARANAKAGGYTNVDFYQSTIDRIPLPDASVDCVISNCVLNLAPDKPAVFREIARVLKPGGVAVLSDYKLMREYEAEFKKCGLVVEMCPLDWTGTFPPLRILVARKLAPKQNPPAPKQPPQQPAQKQRPVKPNRNK